jgi:hypothetical protein
MIQKMRLTCFPAITLFIMIFLGCKNSYAQPNLKINFEVDDKPLIQESINNRDVAFFKNNNLLISKLNKACNFAKFLEYSIKTTKKSDGFIEVIGATNTIKISEINTSDQLLKCESSFDYYKNSLAPTKCEVIKKDGIKKQEQYLLDLDQFLKKNYGMNKTAYWKTVLSLEAKNKKHGFYNRLTEEILIRDGTLSCKEELTEVIGSIK